jgi:hypothetical protein
MTKASKPIFSDDVIQLARDELRYHRQGDRFNCAIARSHGRDFVLARAASDSSKRGSVYAIDEDGKIYPTQLLDCLWSVVDEPDCYYFTEEGARVEDDRFRR